MGKKMIALIAGSVLLVVAVIIALVGAKVGTGVSVREGKGVAVETLPDLALALSVPGYEEVGDAQALPVSLAMTEYVTASRVNSTEKVSHTIDETKTGTKKVYVTERGVYVQAKGKVVTKEARTGSDMMSYSRMVEYEGELYMDQTGTYVRFVRLDYMWGVTDPSDKYPADSDEATLAYVKVLQGKYGKWIKVDEIEEDLPADEQRVACKYLQDLAGSLFDWKYVRSIGALVGEAQLQEGEGNKSSYQFSGQNSGMHISFSDATSTVVNATLHSSGSVEVDATIGLTVSSWQNVAVKVNVSQALSSLQLFAKIGAQEGGNQ